MKALIPSITTFMIAMIFKYTDFMKSFAPKIQTIILQVMNWDVRMEGIGL